MKFVRISEKEQRLIDGRNVMGFVRKIGAGHWALDHLGRRIARATSGSAAMRALLERVKEEYDREDETDRDPSDGSSGSTVPASCIQGAGIAGEAARRTR